LSVTEIAPGLHRWTSRHDEWDEDVGSVAIETDDGLLLVDPIDPPPSFRRPRHVMLTVFWHYRSTPSVRTEHVWAHERAVRRLRNRGVEVTDPFVAGDELPGGVQAFETARDSEVVYWLPRHGAVAVGDVLLGAGAKPRATAEPLRLCPERWLGKATHLDLKTSLQPLLELPLQRVLVSHGTPVLRAGKRELAALLA
jgi:hypothetical protein